MSFHITECPLAIHPCSYQDIGCTFKVSLFFWKTIIILQEPKVKKGLILIVGHIGAEQFGYKTSTASLPKQIFLGSKHNTLGRAEMAADIIVR